MQVASVVNDELELVEVVDDDVLVIVVHDRHLIGHDKRICSAKLADSAVLGSQCLVGKELQYSG